MSIDMSQFHAVFIEESREHLDEIEQLLMQLSIEAPDIEELNSIFRAAHSIKGGSGIFGFEALIAVTHVMESLFDKARQQQFDFTQQVIDQLLVAVDALRSLLASYSHDEEPDWSLVNRIAEQLEALLHEPVESIQVDDGFGFFNEPVAVSKEEGFGFFDEVIADVAEDDGFGFFQEIVLPPEEDGFGFFEALPGPDADNSPRPLTVADTANLTTADANVTASPRTQNAELTPATKNVQAGVTSPATSAPAAPVAREPAVKAKSDSSESNSIRVDISKIDNLVNMVGELVITQSMLSLIGQELTGSLAERIQTALVELARNTRELQEGIMSIRMLPLSFVFNRFPRVVRDLSQKLNKQVELRIEGGQTEIDKGLIERLVDPLTHLVRNSLDHGIEQPAQREEQGKPAMGVLTLRAEQKGGNIIITVLDDGAGLNRERILQKAREKGIELPDEPTDQQVWQLIMAPGFSTAAQVTDVSGRGVGMDVVKRNIEAMGGRLDIDSASGIGSSFQIRLPLTLAILDGMSVAVGDQQFIIPLVNIIESVQPERHQLKLIANQQMLELRDAYWPIVQLQKVMQIDQAKTHAADAILVLIESSKTRYALMVDDLIGQQQVVIKSLEQHYRRVPGIAGATIMGDGSVALILDVESLANHVEQSISERELI